MISSVLDRLRAIFDDHHRSKGQMVSADDVFWDLPIGLRCRRIPINQKGNWCMYANASILLAESPGLSRRRATPVQRTCRSPLTLPHHMAHLAVDVVRNSIRD